MKISKCFECGSTGDSKTVNGTKVTVLISYPKLKQDYCGGCNENLGSEYIVDRFIEWEAKRDGRI
tara:strand:- start:425 stop:619 length:195 start_codon:yes stop_codon:yes gene_type:complete